MIATSLSAGTCSESFTILNNAMRLTHEIFGERYWLSPLREERKGQMVLTIIAGFDPDI